VPKEEAVRPASRAEGKRTRRYLRTGGRPDRSFRFKQAGKTPPQPGSSANSTLRRWCLCRDEGSSCQCQRCPGKFSQPPEPRLAGGDGAAIRTQFFSSARPYRRRCRPIRRRSECPRLHRGAQHRFWRGQVRAGDTGRAAIVGTRTHSCGSTRPRSRKHLPQHWKHSPSRGRSIAARSQRGRQRPVG
jgi:hypothetical protein